MVYKNFSRITFITKNIYFYLNTHLYVNIQTHIVLKKKTYLQFLKNDFKKPHLSKYLVKTFYHINSVLPKKQLTKFLNLVANLFILNKNILFMDYEFNYNYLPISNELLFIRSSKKLFKLLKYFNVTTIIYLNLKDKKYIFKKMFSYKLINVAVDVCLAPQKFDLCLNVCNTYVSNYLLHILTLNIYMKVKNKI